MFNFANTKARIKMQAIVGVVIVW